MTATLDRQLMAFAEEVGDSGPVAVEGERTRWHVGGSLAPDARVVRAPTGVLEHRPEEMTIRLRAGTSVADLHAELAATGQRTALPERGGTVGGAVAVGENALSVLGRGRVRDAVLQVRYVSADGAIVTGGGPTVKNVTGFDLPRLLVGSLGTLGLIGEVILRTNPSPVVSCWLEARDADPFAVWATLAKPSALLWDGRRTWVELEGHPPDVAAQRLALAALGRWTECGGPPALPPYRWSMRPADLRGLDPERAGPFVASIGVGTVFASSPAPPGTPSPALRALAARLKHEFDPAGRLNPGRDVLPG